MYFSEIEVGTQPREQEEIGHNAWNGVLAVIQTRVDDGSFGAGFPLICGDGNYVWGTDERKLDAVIRAEIPQLSEFAKVGISDWPEYLPNSLRTSDPQPPMLIIADLIEFCWKHIGKPTEFGDHDYFNHKHLDIDVELGRTEFCGQVETIFRRNGIALELTPEGRVQRMVPKVLQEHVVDYSPEAGDADLDGLIRTAQRKFVDPNRSTRREAVEALWDAWERLKTLSRVGSKKMQVKAMLDRTAGGTSPKFRAALEREATELTTVGNTLRIRHSETDQESIAESEHLDYLYFRLFVLVRLVLESR